MHTKSEKRKRTIKSDKNQLAPLFHYQRTWVNTTNESLHLELAGQLLRRSLARKDYDRALDIYRTLITCKASSEELLWKVGSEILSRNRVYEPQCLKFLQQVHLKSKICREAVLVELALYQMRCGQIQEARKTLELNITVFPYSDNAQIQGYYGVIEFAMYNMAMEEKRKNPGSSFQMSQDHSHSYGGSFNLLGDAQSGDDGSDFDDDGDSGTSLWDARIMSHKFSAIKHLERALELDNQNDGFLAYLVRLKCGRVSMAGWDKKRATLKRKAAIQEMKLYLKSFYNDNNSSMLALQLLAALENRKKRQTLELILALNPAADSELYVRPLVELMWEQLPEDQRNIISRISGAHSNSPIHKDSTEIISNESLDKGNVLGQSRNSTQSFESILPTSEHQLDVKYIRPILQLLLTRAEFNALKPWEEQEIVKITMYFDSYR
ncbi:hypothetical protein EC991_006331 [Linnemannia zychae]|nr:hypothetical protein EC991_006331 [Linnemannia zychae]